MYLPEPFSEEDMTQILAFVNENAFATLVSCDAGVPVASHIPMMIEPGEPLRLRGHLAKNNSQCRTLNSADGVLTIFQGPHCYISPSNYQGGGAPTWNYTAVHMSGHCRVMEDKEELRHLLHAMSKKYESMQPQPVEPTYPEMLLEQVVGFEIEVSQVEAKFKLSQNRSKEDRGNIISSLSSSHDPQARAIAALMVQREMDL